MSETIPAIKNLFSGGIITNYSCSSKCEHCLYRSSPGRERDYITPEQLRKNARAIREGGCKSVHVGGGEPFLKVQELLTCLNVLKDEGVEVEYVETNSNWFQSPEQAAEIIRAVKSRGVGTLLVSISPFHIGHIPLRKVKGVMSACQDEGVHVLPWSADFLTELDALDDTKTHSMEELSEFLGEDYFERVSHRYWIHPGGRVFEFLSRFKKKLPLEEILSAPPCKELTDTNHFHMDLFGFYVPGLCSGLAISVEDLGEELPGEKYPLLNLLYHGGIRALYEKAMGEGFEPGGEYFSKCHLCNEIRDFLATQQDYSELRPKGYYTGDE